MKIHLVDYATEAFYGSREMLHMSLKKYDVNIFSYGPDNLDKQFKDRNKDVLKQHKGAGYWIWKPYIIKDALNKIGKDDVLIYCDVDQGFIKDPKILADECIKLQIGLYVSPRPTRIWTKRDCFIIMDCDSIEYHNSFLGLGGISCWMKNELCEKILDDWLFYAQDSRISMRHTENVLGKPNLDGFIRHSTDQSIITLLSVKYKISRLMPPNVKITSNHSGFYKKLNIFRKEGKVITRYGVFNMREFEEEIVTKPNLYFDGRQIYLKNPTGQAELWNNPFYRTQ